MRFTSSCSSPCSLPHRSYNQPPNSTHTHSHPNTHYSCPLVASFHRLPAAAHCTHALILLAQSHLFSLIVTLAKMGVRVCVRFACVWSVTPLLSPLFVTWKKQHV